MRFALLLATLLAACIINAGAVQAGPTQAGSAQIGPVTLTCPDAGDALSDRLCAALQQRLADAPPPVGPLRLTLQVHSPRPDILRARLVTDDGVTRHDGPQLELTVMDRATIPDSRIQHLARLLLEQAIPSR